MVQQYVSLQSELSHLIAESLVKEMVEKVLSNDSKPKMKNPLNHKLLEAFRNSKDKLQDLKKSLMLSTKKKNQVYDQELYAKSREYSLQDLNGKSYFCTPSQLKLGV